MKFLWTDRRVFIALVGLVILFLLGLIRGADVVMAISTICGFIAAANASEKIFTKNKKE
jgi:hypothetical protein